MKIAILLATYNSKRYLGEQIASILNQTYKDWTLYVRDDGSTDGTQDLIEDYVLKYPNKIIHIVNGNNGLKAYHNFLSLLYDVDADYYLFSDHDDVWLPNKIELSLNLMQEAIDKFGNEIPLLVYSDMKVVNENIEIINNSFWKYSKLLPNCIKFEELVFCNSVNGCTILINQKAKDVSKKNIPYCTMHDMLTAQSVAANYGKLLKLDEPTVLYRQHANNVIGARDVNIKYFLTKLIHPFEKIKLYIALFKQINKIKRVSVLKFIYYKIKIVILRLSASIIYR